MTLGLLAVAAGLAWQWWDERRAAKVSPPDRGDPETLVADLASVDLTPDARALKRLARLGDASAPWADLDRDNLDLEHRIRRAVVPEDAS